MTGARAAASRSTSAVRLTIPGRAAGGWNFESGSSNPSLVAAACSPPDSTAGASMISGFILQNVLVDQYGINEAAD
jgi:hypothetical protein